MRSRIALATLAAVTQAACYGIQTVGINELGAGRVPRVWVTKVDKTEIEFNDAQVFRGNLVGFVDGKYRELPPADVSEVRVRKMSGPRTLALVGGAIAGFAIVAVAVSGTEDHFDSCVGSDDCDEEQLRVGYRR